MFAIRKLSKFKVTLRAENPKVDGLFAFTPLSSFEAIFAVSFFSGSAPVCLSIVGFFLNKVTQTKIQIFTDFISNYIFDIH